MPQDIASGIVGRSDWTSSLVRWTEGRELRQMDRTRQLIRTGSSPIRLGPQYFRNTSGGLNGIQGDR